MYDKKMQPHDIADRLERWRLTWGSSPNSCSFRDLNARHEIENMPGPNLLLFRDLI